VVSSWTESVWDAHERALVDAYQDWRADLHSCGRPLSESLRVRGREDPKYVVGTQVCVACLALERHRHTRAEADEKAGRKGLEAARVDTVYTLDEMRAAEALEPLEGG
jgi:hypothetical protein